ncbi:MAG: hypothetical protein ACRDVW_05835 [Acidimicrobiales bacterium]
MPRPGQVVWCQRWPGTGAPNCGLRMRWDEERELWRPMQVPASPRFAEH